MQKWSLQKVAGHCLQKSSIDLDISRFGKRIKAGNASTVPPCPLLFHCENLNDYGRRSMVNLTGQDRSSRSLLCCYLPLARLLRQQARLQAESAHSEPVLLPCCANQNMDQL